MTKISSQKTFLSTKTFVVPLLMLALLLSWRVLFFYFNLGSEYLMAPWEYDRTGLPSLGTWARRINDFFDGPGSAYFATLLVATNVITVAVSLVDDARHRTSKTRTLWAATLTNYVYLTAIFIYWGLITGLYTVFDVKAPGTPNFDALSVGFFFLLLGVYIVCQALLLKRILKR